MSDKPNRSRGLGRGLSALMADIDVQDVDTATSSSSAQTVRQIPIERLSPNPDQPRKRFDPEDLADLTASVREKGILQPLIVRTSPTDAKAYQIVAGERRWRAAQQAPLHEVPVIVRDLTDTDVLEIGIIENIQRADLNPVEEAMGYRQLIDTFGHTQDQLATALGKSRSHIANLMRLLNLPEPILDHLRMGRLSAGHARALLTAPNAAQLCDDIIDKGLSVRETERRAKADQAPKTPPAPKAEKDSDTRALEQDLSAATGLMVRIEHLDVSGAGQVTLRYRSLDQLDRLCALLSAGLPDDSI